MEDCFNVLSLLHGYLRPEVTIFLTCAVAPPSRPPEGAGSSAHAPHLKALSPARSSPPAAHCPLGVSRPGLGLWGRRMRKPS